MIRTVDYWPAAVDQMWIERDILSAQFGSRDPSGKAIVDVQEQAGTLRIVQTPFTPPLKQSLPPGWSLIESSDFQGEFAGIVEGTTAPSRTYTVPVTDRQTLARLRPKAVRDEFGPRQVGEILDHIGPYQVAGNLLWFGKTFYDGEGLTGVGGFGYFDLMSRRYAMFAPAALLDWSASAILVEPDAIWTGLVNRPEGAENSGGLLRYDRNTTQTLLFPVKSVITNIVRYNGALYLGTVHGLYVMRGSTFTRYLIEPALDGSIDLIERAPL